MENSSRRRTRNQTKSNKSEAESEEESTGTISSTVNCVFKTPQTKVRKKKLLPTPPSQPTLDNLLLKTNTALQKIKSKKQLFAGNINQNEHVEQDFVHLQNLGETPLVTPAVVTAQYGPYKAAETVSPLTSPLNKLAAANCELVVNINAIDIDNRQTHQLMANPPAVNADMTELNNSDLVQGHNGTVNAPAVTTCHKTPHAVTTTTTTMSKSTVSNSAISTSVSTNITSKPIPTSALMLPGYKTQMHDAMAHSAALHTSNTMPSIAGIPTFAGQRQFTPHPTPGLGNLHQDGAQLTDVHSVYSMFNDVTAKLDKIQASVSSLNTSKNLFAQQIGSLQYDHEQMNENISQQQNSIDRCEDQLDLMRNITKKYSQSMNELHQRVLKLEKRSMQQNLVISGIKEEENENCAQQVSNLLTQDLRITEEIGIKRAHRMGRGNNRPIVAKLQNKSHKGAIFPELKKLKGTQKYVNDQLPEELEEKARIERYILSCNNKLQQGAKKYMSFTKGKLMIGKQHPKAYVPRIIPLQPDDILNLTEADLKSLQEVPLFTIDSCEEKNSKYLGYACMANNLSDVNTAYKHLKVKHSDATHIMMAYKLAGVDMTKDIGCTSDGEYGAGLKLLKKLQELGKQQCALFIVRFYGGTHLNKRRFEIPLEMADQLLEKMEQNEPRISRLSMRQFKSHDTTIRSKYTRGNHNSRAMRGTRGGMPTQRTQHTAAHSYLKRFSHMVFSQEETEQDSELESESERGHSHSDREELLETWDNTT